MTTAAPNTKKPSHRLPPAEGTIPTPGKETKMLTTVHPTTDTGQAPDWRDLLDDPEVLRIIRQVARTQRDAMLRSDAESFLTLEAVGVAQRYVAADRGPDEGNHWYRFLHAGLKLVLRGQHDRTYGYGESVRVSRAASVDAILVEYPGRDGIFHPLGEGLEDIDRSEHAMQVVSEHPQGITPAKLADELGIDHARARNLLARGARRGAFIRIRRGLYAPTSNMAFAA